MIVRKQTMSKTIGYVRVSSITQNTARQLEGIKLDKIFEDKVSGKSINRPAFQAMLDYIREGDILYVHSLDRFARNLDDLRKYVNLLTSKGIEICFVKEGLRFSNEENHMSKLLLSVMGAFAEFERSIILERQREGIAIAKKEGKFKGKKSKFQKDDKLKMKKLIDEGETVTNVAKKFNISRITVYRLLKDLAA